MYIWHACEVAKVGVVWNTISSYKEKLQEKLWCLSALAEVNNRIWLWNNAVDNLLSSVSNSHIKSLCACVLKMFNLHRLDHVIILETHEVFCKRMHITYPRARRTITIPWLVISRFLCCLVINNTGFGYGGETGPYPPRRRKSIIVKCWERNFVFPNMNLAAV